MKVCPVCHGHVDEKDAAANNRMVYYFGRFYYLMCRECKAAFMLNPDRYIDSKHRERVLVTNQCEPPKGSDRPAI